MAQFAANNQEAATTKVTPFFANYGFHPHFDPNLQHTDFGTEALYAQTFANKMSKLQGFRCTEILFPQDRYQESTNKSRTVAPAFQIGDKVFLSTISIRTAHPSRKLDWKQISPCSISKLNSLHTDILTLLY